MLGTAMGLSWLEVHVLSPAEVPETTVGIPPRDLLTALTAVVKLDHLRLEGAVDRAGAPELTHSHGTAL